MPHLTSRLTALIGPGITIAVVPDMSAAAPRLNLVVLRSPDIERAAVFYRALGLVLARHAHGLGRNTTLRKTAAWFLRFTRSARNRRPQRGCGLASGLRRWTRL